jgi:Arc-like DNA binding domain
MARKPADAVQLKLRFQEALRRRLERAADQAERSMNAEIIYRLEKSFERDPAAQMVDLAMWLESTSEPDAAYIPPKKNWKDDPAKASTVRAAVDLIIAAVAGLPRDGQPEDRGRAEVLATVVLRKFGLNLPT